MNGYFSLIQYCPDRARLESANVGVVVSVPDQHVLEVRMSSSNDRVRRFFRQRGPELDAFRILKETFKSRVRQEQFGISTLAELEEFIAARGNDFRLTPPRPVRVDHAPILADELLHELVGGRAERHTSHDEASLKRVRDRFAMDDVAALIRKSVRVNMPEVGRQIFAPFAFQNGVLNLIKPQSFGADTQRSFRDASLLSVEGTVLERHVPAGGAARLIVVPMFSNATPESRRIAEQLFADFSVRYTPVESIEDLVEEVKRSGHV